MVSRDELPRLWGAHIPTASFPSLVNRHFFLSRRWHSALDPYSRHYELVSAQITDQRQCEVDAHERYDVRIQVTSGPISESSRRVIVGGSNLTVSRAVPKRRVGNAYLKTAKSCIWSRQARFSSIFCLKKRLFHRN